MWAWVRGLDHGWLGMESGLRRGGHGEWIEEGLAWRVYRGGVGNGHRDCRGGLGMESGLRGVGTVTRSRRGGHGEWIERGGHGD